MRRTVLGFTVALAAVLLPASAAGAHEEINPKTFSTGQPTFFALSAADETEADLVKVVLHAPAGVAFGETTREPAGWAVSGTEDTITWSGGRVKPDHFDTWGYEIEGADQPGTLAYKVDLAFADGKTNTVEVDVTATAPASSPSTTTTTGAASTTTATGGAAPATRQTSSTSSGTANAALAIAIAALVVGILALAAALRRRPATSGRGGSEPPAPDW